MPAALSLLLLLAVTLVVGCKPGDLNKALDTACDSTQCVSISAVAANIADRLKNKVVGYASYVGSPLGGAAEYGKARTAANQPAVDFKATTKIPMASVSKVVTALAAISLLAKKNVSLEAAIGPYFPSDWTLGPNVAAIKFSELLSHSSGIHNYGNTAQDYADVKQFFAQGIDPSNKTRDYSNYNFSVFRILLPMVNGFVAGDPAQRPAKLAAAYVEIVQQNVFEPLGLNGVDCKPPAQGSGATTYAFSYKFPGTAAGWDWGDDTLACGHAGWYLSINDAAAVLLSLDDGDGRILTVAQFKDMEKRTLGWDQSVDGAGYRYVEKNGGWSWNGTIISTTIAIIGPGVIGALFLNSDIAGEPTIGADTVLSDAYKKALVPKT